VNGANEDLRRRHASVRALDHFVASLPVAADIDLAVGRAFALQQSLGGVAIRAITGRIDLDGRHSISALSDLSIWDFAPAPQPARIPAHRPVQRPPAIMCGCRRRPWRRTSAHRRPAPGDDRQPRPCVQAGTRNAPWTLSARSVRDRPTCCGVAPAMGDRDTANRRYCAGKNGRLIVSSCPSPSPMQGYRNWRTGIGQKFAASVRHQASHHG